MADWQQWRSDPTWHFEERLFDGDEPTDRVRNDGVEYTDPEGTGASEIRPTGRGASVPAGAPAPVEAATSSSPSAQAMPTLVAQAPGTAAAAAAWTAPGDLLDDLFGTRHAEPTPAPSFAAGTPPPVAPAPARAEPVLVSPPIRPRKTPPAAPRPKQAPVEALEDGDPANLRARLLGAASGGLPPAPKGSLARPYAAGPAPGDFEHIDHEPQISPDLFARDGSVPLPMRSPRGRADGRAAFPDELRARRRRRVRRMIRLVVLVLLAASLAGVVTVQWRRHQAGLHGAWAKVWDPRVQQFAQFVEKDRGRKFLHPVTVRFLPPAEFDRQVASSGASSGSVAATDAPTTEAATLSILGLDRSIGGARAAEPGTVPGAAGSVVGIYSPLKRRVTVRGSDLTVAVRTTLVHELTHAWQDQYFGLERLDENAFTEGQRLGLQAVVEGDAEMAAQSYLAALPAAVTETPDVPSQPTDPATTAPATGSPAASAPATGTPAGEAPSPAADATAALEIARLHFVYDLGTAFMTIVTRDGGLEARDAVFDRLPQSDAEVLDPSLYLSGMQPRNVAPPALDAGDTLLPGTHPTQIGALSWFTLLADRNEPRVALTAMEGWRGDSAIVFSRGIKTCARAVIATGDTDSQTRLFDAFTDWASQGRPDLAKIVRAGADVEVTVCSGGPQVGSASTGLDLYLFRSKVLIEGAGKGLLPIARCSAEAVIAATNRTDIPSLDSVGVAVQAAAERCRR